MAESTVYKKLENIVQRIDPKSQVLRAWNLEGGISAAVTAFEVLHSNGNRKRYVLRQHGEVDRARNPHIATHEFRLLEALKSAGLPTPAPYVLDETDELFGSPFVVIEFMEGTPNFHPSKSDDFIIQFATTLAGIHSQDLSSLDLTFLPKQEELYETKLATRPALLDESLSESRIRDVLEDAWPFTRENEDRLLHGDYWPGNTLWNDGRLTGIIDWEDAAIGDPLVDLANARLEILWAFGGDAMNVLTQHYQSLMSPQISVTLLPYWDLCAALRPASKLSGWGLEKSKLMTMRLRHKRFVDQAIAKITHINH